MFEKILLPLDGSELAEAAIPYVRDLAGQLNSEVHLLHACAPEQQAYFHMHQIYMNSMAESLRRDIKNTWQPEGLPEIQVAVIRGDPAKVIMDYIKDRSINMVVMTTHGTSGFRPGIMGNVVDKIIRTTGILSLLIRINEEGYVSDRKALIRKILLPLDHSEASQIAVPYAIQLAKKFKASITLFSMAQTAYAQQLNSLGSGIGINWDSLDAATARDTENYLKDIEDSIIREGVEVNHTSYLGVDAAYEILEMEKKTQADLVVMATRGRSPVARWAFGSVAEKVLREGDRPILLVREKFV